uniref:G protein-coupled receptor 101 n=1 Tax=Molossus molossus TaxID=27622 RepID=A0A7J8J5N0_MOLMO|nr:G protein-coupled receptor 101 [Molossus molossus]
MLFCNTSRATTGWRFQPRTVWRMRMKRERGRMSSRVRARFHSQNEGGIKAKVGSVEAQEGRLEVKEESVEAKGSKEVKESSLVADGGSMEGKESGTNIESSMKAGNGHIEVNQCNIDLGKDDMEFGENDINFSEDDIKAVNIQESFPKSHQNSNNDPPLPKCYQCKAAKVIFLIMFS